MQPPPAGAPQGWESPPPLVTRHCRPEDHDALIHAVGLWWEGRDLTAMLPRLFAEHFGTTSFVVHQGAELAAFLVGFLSPARPREGYIHFVGVHPHHRGQGLATDLYRRFFRLCLEQGRDTVRACTSPVNKGSIAFHTRLGFAVAPGAQLVDGVPVTPDYNRPGDHKVLFVKRLDPTDLP